VNSVYRQQRIGLETLSFPEGERELHTSRCITAEYGKLLSKECLHASQTEMRKLRAVVKQVVDALISLAYDNITRFREEKLTRRDKLIQ
jgi:hypothetical protein